MRLFALSALVLCPRSTRLFDLFGPRGTSAVGRRSSGTPAARAAVGAAASHRLVLGLRRQRTNGRTRRQPKHGSST